MNSQCQQNFAYVLHKCIAGTQRKDARNGRWASMLAPARRSGGSNIIYGGRLVRTPHLQGGDLVFDKRDRQKRLWGAARRGRERGQQTLRREPGEGELVREGPALLWTRTETGSVTLWTLARASWWSCWFCVSLSYRELWITHGKLSGPSLSRWEHHGGNEMSGCLSEKAPVLSALVLGAIRACAGWKRQDRRRRVFHQEQSSH